MQVPVQGWCLAAWRRSQRTWRVLACRAGCRRTCAAAAASGRWPLASYTVCRCAAAPVLLLLLRGRASPQNADGCGCAQPDALFVVIPALALPTRLAALAYMAMFVLGTMAAMGGYTAVIGEAFCAALPARSCLG